MVGGLVENQEIDRLQEQADHSQSAALTAAEHLHLLIRSLATKHKGTQYVVDAQADIALRHIVDGLEHGETLVEQLRLVLGEIAYLHIMAHLQVALKGNLAHDTFHQRGFALTVLTHEGHFLTTLDGEVHMVEDHMIIRLLHLVADHGIVT